MHKTVLLNEAIDNLNIKEDGIYVDCTLGFGGHSGLILERIKRGFLFAFDQDDMALEYSEKKLKEIGSNFELIKSNFAYIKEELNKRNVTEVDGILFFMISTSSNVVSMGLDSLSLTMFLAMLVAYFSSP